VAQGYKITIFNLLHQSIKEFHNFHQYHLDHGQLAGDLAQCQVDVCVQWHGEEEVSEGEDG
jgi:hypothetical protein